MSVNGPGTVPVPFPRGPRRTPLVRRESGTGTKAANHLFSSGKSIALLWSQSHFHDSLFSLSNTQPTKSKIPPSLQRRSGCNRAIGNVRLKLPEQQERVVNIVRPPAVRCAVVAIVYRKLQV